MTRQETEKRLGRTLGLATALLSILQGIDTDAQSDGETSLAHAQEGRAKCGHIPFCLPCGTTPFVDTVGGGHPLAGTGGPAARHWGEAAAVMIVRAPGG